jgi:hypothetical protein
MSTLKAMSDAATPGPWKLKLERDPDGDGFLVLPEIGVFDDPSWFPLFKHGSARENMEFIAALVNAYRDGRLHEAPPPEEVARGMVLVPREPTQAMIDAGADTINTRLSVGKQAALVYRYMIGEHESCSQLPQGDRS